MQDRFRLKFWDNTDKELGEVINIDFDNGFVDFKTKDGKTSTQIKCGELIQCTGLKDKSGKLIYEGDIVKFSSIYGHGIFEIKWNDEFAMYGFEDEETDFTDLRYFIEKGAYIEILGNLYEKP